MTDSVIRVAVVDDDPLVRLGLVGLLGSEPGVDIVGEAGDGADVPDLVSRTRPDVVLMDVRMPRVDGIAATRRLARLDDAPKVLVVTTFEHDDLVFDALLAGARGFVLKRTPPDELVRVVRAVATTDALVFPGALRELARRRTAGRGEATSAEGEPVASPRPTWAEALTARELEVLHLVARGLTNAEIAAQLVIGVETVKSHLRSLLAKAGARDRTALVVAAYDGGVVRPGAGID